jgi:hypothetical protein
MRIPRYRRSLAAAVVVALSGHAGVVSGQGGLHGLPPRQTILDEDAYVRMPLLPADQAYAGIDGLRMKEWVKEIAAISIKSRDAGDIVWGRIAGMKSEQVAADWLEARFRASGLQDLRRQHFDLRPQWTPVSWEFSVRAGGAPPRTFATAWPALETAATPAAGLELDAVWVGLGSAADYVGRDVRGKAVFIHNVGLGGAGLNATQTAGWYGASKRAMDGGAAAIVLVHGETGNVRAAVPLGGQVTAIPGFVVGYEDGAAIRDLIGSGQPVKVRLRSEIRRLPDLKTVSVWGTLPGATDENILVMAHTDAYFEGAQDNASGMAVMLALAEHYSKIPRERRRRTLMFVGAAGHHAGSPQARWLHEHRATALAKTALMINCEHVAATATYLYRDVTYRANAFSALRAFVNGSSRLNDIAFRAFRTFGVATFPDAAEGGGEMNAIKYDAPAVQLVRSSEDRHTDADRADWVPAAGMEAVARAYAKIIDAVNGLERQQLLPGP